jgi:hypothetical protein
MRGGAEALECRDPGGSRRAQGNLPPNQTGSPSFFLFLFSFFFDFFLSFFDREGRSKGWYVVAQWSGGYQAGYSREGDGGRTAEQRWRN